MQTVTFSRVFAAAHRVWNDPGKCHNIHGHNYAVEVEIDLYEGELNEQGFITPFDAVKKVIDAFDHSLILDRGDPLTHTKAFDEVFADLDVTWVNGTPSTERLAQIIATTIHANVMESRETDIDVVVTVSLRETEGIEATARHTSDVLEFDS